MSVPLAFSTEQGDAAKTKGVNHGYAYRPPWEINQVTSMPFSDDLMKDASSTAAPPPLDVVEDKRKTDMEESMMRSSERTLPYEDDNLDDSLFDDLRHYDYEDNQEESNDSYPSTDKAINDMQEFLDEFSSSHSQQKLSPKPWMQIDKNYSLHESSLTDSIDKAMNDSSAILDKALEEMAFNNTDTQRNLTKADGTQRSFSYKSDELNGSFSNEEEFYDDGSKHHDF